MSSPGWLYFTVSEEKNDTIAICNTYPAIHILQTYLRHHLMGVSWPRHRHRDAVKEYEALAVAAKGFGSIKASDLILTL